MSEQLPSDECAGHMSGCHVRDGSGICPNCKQPVGPAEQPTKDQQLHRIAKANLLASVPYKIDPAAVSCMLSEIDSLRTALRAVTSCSSCEMCRNIAKRALGITEQADEVKS